MRYVKAQIENYRRDTAYRVYVTDTLQAIAENTTHILGANGIVDYGKSMPTRWYDVVNPQIQEKIEEDPRSCIEIASDMWDRIRGKAVSENGD